MNIFDRALIEKTVIENGWENVLKSTSAEIVIASSRHQVQARITHDQHPGKWMVELPEGLLQQELSRSFPLFPKNGCSFGVDDYPHLALPLHRAAELALSLPHQAAVVFVQKVKQELPSNAGKLQFPLNQHIAWLTAFFNLSQVELITETIPFRFPSGILEISVP